jgi:hypothetical protein
MSTTLQNSHTAKSHTRPYLPFSVHNCTFLEITVLSKHSVCLQRRPFRVDIMSITCRIVILPIHTHDLICLSRSLTAQNRSNYTLRNYILSRKFACLQRRPFRVHIISITCRKSHLAKSHTRHYISFSVRNCTKLF